MKKHILIAIALVVTVVIPLAAATKSASKRQSPDAAASTKMAALAESAEESGTDKPAVEKPAIQRTPVSTTAKKKSTSTPKDPELPRAPAKQSRARQLVADLTDTQQEKLLTFLNEASVKELAAIRGVSTVRGTAILQARPFAGIDDVVLVSGVGEGTFSEIVKHGKTLSLAQKTAAVTAKTKSTASSRKSS